MRKQRSNVAPGQQNSASFKIAGANAAAFNSNLPEFVLSGPARCGKTFAMLHKIQKFAIAYPDLRVAMVRKTRVSMNETTLETWEKEIYPKQYLRAHQIQRGSRAQYQYPNGSIVAVFGMDSPDKLLGSSWDFIYCNECSELNEDQWDQLNSRILSHGAPYAQLIGDCNPPEKGKDHWLWKRKERGATTLFFSDQSLNPTITEEDKERLRKLRPDLRRRFSEGSWDAIPNEGGLWKADWFKYLDVRPGGGKWARGWDIASGTSKNADETAGCLMGICDIDGHKGAIVIADIHAGQWSPHTRNEEMRLRAESDKALEARGYFEKGFGIGTDMTLSVLEALEGYSMWAVKPKGSKLFRADPLAAQTQAGNVYLVRGAWNSSFVNECCGFTGEEGGIDNKVDAASLAYNMLMR